MITPVWRCRHIRRLCQFSCSNWRLAVPYWVKLFWKFWCENIIHGPNHLYPVLPLRSTWAKKAGSAASGLWHSQLEILGDWFVLLAVNTQYFATSCLWIDASINPLLIDSCMSNDLFPIGIYKPQEGFEEFSTQLVVMKLSLEVMLMRGFSGCLSSHQQSLLLSMRKASGSQVTGRCCSTYQGTTTRPSLNFTAMWTTASACLLLMLLGGVFPAILQRDTKLPQQVWSFIFYHCLFNWIFSPSMMFPEPLELLALLLCELNSLRPV